MDIVSHIGWLRVEVQGGGAGLLPSAQHFSCSALYQHNLWSLEAGHGFTGREVLGRMCSKGEGEV
eukprot:5911816-Karenia_brevis.AAC.1